MQGKREATNMVTRICLAIGYVGERWSECPRGGCVEEGDFAHCGPI